MIWFSLFCEKVAEIRQLQCNVVSAILNLLRQLTEGGVCVNESKGILAFWQLASIICLVVVFPFSPREYVVVSDACACCAIKNACKYSATTDRVGRQNDSPSFVLRSETHAHMRPQSSQVVNVVKKWCHTQLPTVFIGVSQRFSAVL